MISVITINLNNKAGLERTLKSIQPLKQYGIESIVIDGNSKDGSLDLIQKSLNIIDTYISEPDSGIYNAMNKGIFLSKKAFCYFLNSGDEFLLDLDFQDIINSLSNDVEVLSINIETENEKGDRKIWKTKASYIFSEIALGHIPHQGFIINRLLFTTNGKFDETFRIAGDWAWLIKCIAQNPRIIHLELVMARHYLDGISNDNKSISIQETERKSFLEKHFSFYYEDLKELAKYREYKNYFFTKYIIRIFKFVFK